MKRMNLHICAILPLLLLLVMWGCERRPLVDISNTHYVRVYLDENLRNVTFGHHENAVDKPQYSSPDVIRVALTDPESGRLVTERYLRDRKQDNDGRYYYEGYIITEPGYYNMIAYNFDTEVTQIRSTGHYFDMSAYTNEIASHLRSKIASRADGDPDEKIVYDPDHLFVACCEGVHVPYVDHIDTLKNSAGKPYFEGSSVVKSYYLQIKVKGLQYVSSAVSLLTGMAGSVTMHDRDLREEDPVTLYFELQRSDEALKRGTDDEVTVYATFNTFGKIPDEENKLDVTFDFLTTYGSAVSETIDISDYFTDPDVNPHIDRQWILIDKVIEVPEPPEKPDNGGGFNPDVGEWNDENVDIII